MASWTTAADRTEPTANQRLWDAGYYGLNLRVNPADKTIAGWTTIRATVLADSTGKIISLPYIELDLDDAMEIQGVRSGSGLVDPSWIVHADDLLRIRLSPPASTGDTVEVEVRYGGTPPTSSRDGLNFSTVDGQPMAWCFGGPRGARRWFPCKDHPEDKADRVDLVITVPRGFEVAANGRLYERTETDTTATFRWMEFYPIATYLISFTAYPYSVYEDQYQPADLPFRMPIVFYNVPSAQDSWRPVQAQVKTMIGAFATRYGEYPFFSEKYGHVQVPFSGGMEHQTITSLGSNNESVVAHEISHSWWGDEVTCHTFRDIWLNEGFATWSEALWLEATRGTAAYHARMNDTRTFGSGTIYVPEISDPGRIYDRMLSYYKGSWVLHMLRHVTGDEAFFRGLRAYRASRVAPSGDGTAETAHFSAVMSVASGLDLGPMISRWIYGEGYPIYRYDWSEVTEGPGWGVRIRLRQVQETPVFPMPVDLAVRIDGDGSDTLRTFTVESAGRDSTYTLDLPRRPLRVDLDPEEWILRRVIPPIPAPTWTKPLLVVNGVPWRGDTGMRLRAAYEARAFTAGTDFDFWEDQPPPEDGYPPAIPFPLGHGPVPGEVLGRYGAVLWVGNNFGDDLAAWQQTPMHSYIEAGGNIVLLVPSARTFLLEPYRAWLGVTWAAGDSSVTSGGSVAGWLPDLRPTGTQDAVSLFRVQPGVEGNLLLYADRGDPTRGFGVLRLPAAGAPGRPAGGRFALIGGRPYRWNTDDLRAAMEAILPQMLPPVDAGIRLSMRPAAPNPFRERTKIIFFLPEATTARLDIWSVAGRRVRTLRNGPSLAGWNAESWDGYDEAGRDAASGVYFARVDAGGRTAADRIVRIR